MTQSGAETIRIECPSCKKAMRAKISLVGKKTKCTGCGQLYLIVDGSKPAAQAPAPIAPPSPKVSLPTSPKRTFFQKIGQTLGLWTATKHNENLNRESQLHFHSGDYDKALAASVRHMTFARDEYGTDSDQYATALNNIAAAQYQKGAYVESEQGFQEVVRIRSIVHGPSHTEVARALHNLATVTHGLQRTSDAEALFRKAVDITRPLLENHDPEAAWCLFRLGEYYRILGKYSEAEPMLAKSLAVFRQPKSSINLTLLEKTDSLQLQLAFVCLKCDRRNPAADLLRHLKSTVLPAKRHDFRRNQPSPDLVPFTLNLGTLFFMLEDFETAKQLLSEALKKVSRTEVDKLLDVETTLKALQKFGLWAPDVPSAEIAYFEVAKPLGVPRCSDSECPCADTELTDGTGYLWITQSVVEFRRKLPKLVDVQKRFAGQMVVFGPGVAAPIAMCQSAARRRRLDLRTAAKDYSHWLKAGMVPLRVTPVNAN